MLPPLYFVGEKYYLLYLKGTAHNIERTLKLCPWTLFLVVILHLKKKSKSFTVQQNVQLIVN